MHNYGLSYNMNWSIIINNIVEIILDPEIIAPKKLYSALKKIREQFYILFITNISTQTIIRKIMLKLIAAHSNISLKYQIVNITSIFEQRLSQGTRHVIHLEAFVTNLIYLLNKNELKSV